VEELGEGTGVAKLGRWLERTWQDRNIAEMEGNKCPRAAPTVGSAMPLQTLQTTSKTPLAQAGPPHAGNGDP